MYEHAAHDMPNKTQSSSRSCVSTNEDVDNKIVAIYLKKNVFITHEYNSDNIYPPLSATFKKMPDQ